MGFKRDYGICKGNRPTHNREIKLALVALGLGLTEHPQAMSAKSERKRERKWAWCGEHMIMSGLVPLGSKGREVEG